MLVCEHCNKQVKSLFKYNDNGKIKYWCLVCLKMKHPNNFTGQEEGLTEVISKLWKIFKKRTNTN